MAPKCAATVNLLKPGGILPLLPPDSTGPASNVMIYHVVFKTFQFRASDNPRMVKWKARNYEIKINRGNNISL